MMPSDDALQMAARCWCDPETSDRVMDDKLAIAFAKRIDRLVIALNKVQSHGLNHFEDCSNREYDDQPCNCGMEKTELIVRQALEQLDSKKQSGE